MQLLILWIRRCSISVVSLSMRIGISCQIDIKKKERGGEKNVVVVVKEEEEKEKEEGYSSKLVQAGN